MTAKNEIPIWILCAGGFGIVLGVATLGHRVIHSLGTQLMKVTPSRGFTIELGAAVVIIAGSILGLPLSTTHCQVGAEVGIGAMEGCGHGVAWPLMFKVGCGWIFTLVVCALQSAFFFSCLVFSPSMPGFESHNGTVRVEL